MPAEAADVDSDVGEVPADAIKLEHRGQRRQACYVGVGAEDGSVTGVEAPQIAFRRRHEGGVPVDEQPALGGPHGVARMRFPVGEDRSGWLSATFHDELVVTSE